MKILGIIPARLASTRFPEKALADIHGKSMVQRTYEQACKSMLDKVIVATDHRKIFDHVTSFGGQVCMTSSQHASGTDRCFEAFQAMGTGFDYVINIQGDEPFIAPGQIDLLAGRLDGKVELATLVKKIESHEQLFNPNVVKVVVNLNRNAIYFSRFTLPYIRAADPSEWLTAHTFYKHIGMYAYRSDILGKVTRLPVSPLEKAEALEQLRWIENGFTVAVEETTLETIGIDTPEDLERALKRVRADQLP